MQSFSIIISDNQLNWLSPQNQIFLRGKKSNNKALLNHWNFNWQWPLGWIHIFVPARKGRRMAAVVGSFVFLWRYWVFEVLTPTLSLWGVQAKGNVSHNGMRLGSLHPLWWPLTPAGFQCCIRPRVPVGGVGIDHFTTQYAALRSHG